MVPIFYVAKPSSKEELTLHIRNLFSLRKQLQKFYLLQNSNSKTNKLNKSLLELSSKAGDIFLNNVKAYIERNIENIDLNVEKMAHDFHFSHSQFSRKLDAMIGLAPIKYIRYVKLQKASIMLAETD